MDPTPKDGLLEMAGRALTTRFRNPLAFFGTTALAFGALATYCGLHGLIGLEFIFAGTAVLSVGAVVLVVLKNPMALIRDRTLALEELRLQQFGTKEHPLDLEEAESEPVKKHATRGLPPRDRSDVLEPTRERDKVPVTRPPETKK